jgi:hypothetical protein
VKIRWKLTTNRRRDGAAVQLFVLFTAAVPRPKLKAMKTVELLKAYFTEDEILQLAITSTSGKNSLRTMLEIKERTGFATHIAYSVLKQIIDELNKDKK